MTGFWSNTVEINKSNFQFKSLSDWGLNFAVGCNHGCRFCYVPETATNKQAPKLREFGVDDPDSQWGEYVLLRPLNGKRFNASLRKAQNTPLAALSEDGNRAVMLCTTTDPYQVLSGKDHKQMNQAFRRLRHTCLRRIRDNSTLNVRILTRSPLAKEDFDLFKSFGNRLAFGMSLPTLDNDLARIYEPNAPAPTQRLKTLHQAAEAGLNVFVAIAPTYPECGDEDIRATLSAVKALDPITIYHEPINVRAENIARIESHALSMGRQLKTEVFATPEAERRYKIAQLAMVQRLAQEEGVADRLHLWPDSDLTVKKHFKSMRRDDMEKRLGRQMDADELLAFKVQVTDEYAAFNVWIDRWHGRISEWPGKKRSNWQPPELPHFITSP